MWLRVHCANAVPSFDGLNNFMRLYLHAQKIDSTKNIVASNHGGFVWFDAVFLLADSYRAYSLRKFRHGRCVFCVLHHIRWQLAIKYKCKCSDVHLIVCWVNETDINLFVSNCFLDGLCMHTSINPQYRHIKTLTDLRRAKTIPPQQQKKRNSHLTQSDDIIKSAMCMQKFSTFPLFCSHNSVGSKRISVTLLPQSVWLSTESNEKFQVILAIVVFPNSYLRKLPMDLGWAGQTIDSLVFIFLKQ